MMGLMSLSGLLLALLQFSTAALVTVNVPASHYLQNPSTLSSTTHATLHAQGEPLRAPLSKSNKFTFQNVPEGSYLLTIHCRDYFFEPLRVDVGKSAAGVEWVKAWQTFRGNEWDNKGEKKCEVLGSVDQYERIQEAKATIEANVLGPKEYYQQREGFNVMSLFKNPMILMAVFSLGLIVGMPYLLENMDPEAKEEFERMQKSSPMAANPADAIQNFDLAGWMAGTSNKPAAATEQPKIKGADTPKSQQSGSRRKG